jgi:hypothetical protein
MRFQLAKVRLTNPNLLIPGHRNLDPKWLVNRTGRAAQSSNFPRVREYCLPDVADAGRSTAFMRRFCVTSPR